MEFSSQVIDNYKQIKPIIIVSGLPRSGTSMMMKILEAGGISPLTDHLRLPDEDNPKGYYEFEQVKKLSQGDISWLTEAQGKAVKVIAALLIHLPETYNYRIIFMHRALYEVLASQRKMLIRRGEDPDKISDDQLIRLFEKHLRQVDSWILRQANIERIDINYNQILENPTSQINQINQFLGSILNVEKMIQMIDPNLYRHRVDDV